jgi:hypothetical protein
VLGERSRVRRRSPLVQQPGRALDVGEEEGDGAVWEVAAHEKSLARNAHAAKWGLAVARA